MIRFLLLQLASILAAHALFGAHLLSGPMLGHVDKTSAGMWCALDSPSTLTVKVGSTPDLKESDTITIPDFELGTLRSGPVTAGVSMEANLLAS